MSRELTIWHPPTCKPENGKLIIVNEFSNLCFLSVFINDDYAPSEGYRPPFKDVKQWAYVDDILPEEPKSKFDAAIQDGDDVKYNEDLGCRINLSQLKRVAKKPTKKMMGKSTLGEPIDGSVDPEIQKVINENFFDMLDGEEVHCKGVGHSKESTGKLAELIKELEELPCEEKIHIISEIRVKMEKESWINRACYWLSLHDSYSTPTNVKVHNFRKAMEGE